jgi:predicted enzyme related to lactoylglutathione lyase
MDFSLFSMVCFLWLVSEIVLSSYSRWGDGKSTAIPTFISVGGPPVTIFCVRHSRWGCATLRYYGADRNQRQASPHSLSELETSMSGVQIEQ